MAAYQDNGKNFFHPKREPFPEEKRITLPADLQPIPSLEEYRSRGGLSGLNKARSMPPREVIAEVKKSGLRGRGGAGFPTAIKWEGLISDPSPTRYTVCNGSEGEPGTFKDRYLIRRNPYQLLEGILIAAYAVCAKQAFLGLKAKPTQSIAEKPATAQGTLYKVQIGAFSEKANADELLTKAKAAGFKDAFITEN